jgi:LacI family transcriptional regulator
LGKSQDGIPYPCIRIEGAEVYYRLVQHICTKGFTRFAFIGGPSDLIHQIDRLKWFRAAVKKCGLVVDPNHILTTDMSSTGAYEAASELLKRPDPPDAILCVNDQTAYGALHAAHEEGYSVGTEVAITGFDGLRDSVHTEPPLTTLGIPMADLAHRLVHMLLAKLDGEQTELSEVVIRPELHIRASTGG